MQIVCNNMDTKKSFSEHGLRTTGVRQKILATLQAQREPQSARQLHHLLQSTGIDLASVYRNLQTFVQLGLVDVEVRGRERYYTAPEQHHHHLACTQCDRVVCVPCTVRVPAVKGWQRVQHQVSLSGVCQRCHPKK